MMKEVRGIRRVHGGGRVYKGAQQAGIREGANRVAGESAQMWETYLSNLQPPLLSSPLTFWGRRKGRLQMAIVGIWGAWQPVTRCKWVAKRPHHNPVTMGMLEWL